MLSRRTFASATIASAALLARAGDGHAQSPAQNTAQAVGEGQVISKQALIDYARDMSRAPYSAPRADLPRALAQLPLDQYRQIGFKPEARLWANENRSFTVEPLHPGNVFTTPVILRTVENGIIRDQRYQAGQFDFGQLQPPSADAALFFSGFRARAALNGSLIADDVLTFQGASFFRTLARGQRLGLMARALILNLAEAQGEEFPMFRAFWIERPGAGATTLVVHGLLDSESVTGLYRFALRPGDMTICDVEVTLFPRVDLAHVGIAPLTANFLFAPNDRSGIDDVRNGVHEVNGLQVWNGAGEWIWRPLHNPETLQISAFVDQNPKGFGLLQRDRRFESYNDLDARFERRPSVWIEPLSDWGPGQVQLVEIPVNDEVNRNILAYWRPRQPLARGQEHSFTYRMSWGWGPQERHPGAIASGLRVGRAPGGGRRRRFFVDFTSDDFADNAVGSTLKANLSAHRGRILSQDARLVPELRLYRVSFDLDPEAANLVELRLFIERDGQPASETWLYRWTP
ncbi:MAG: glucan biosynthesis protein [Alphaproteobacteria bacterium]